MAKSKGNLIALTGKLRSGKTTASTHISAIYGHSALSFGSYVNYYAGQIFGTNTNKKPRKLLQDFGQAMRKIDENVWVRKLEGTKEMYERVFDKTRFVIDDLRQPNEYRWARENGFTIIRINSAEDVRIEQAKKEGDEFTEKDLAHDTERYVDEFEVDYEVNNNGDYNDFIKQIDNIMEDLNVSKLDIDLNDWM